MLKKLPAVFAGLLLTLSAYAATVELNEHHPDTYTVRKGDTLWSISAQFLRQPWLWPEVWQANPQIKNPHLIYPGDVISLAYLNGRPILSVNSSSRESHEESSGPHVRATRLDETIKPVPLERIQDFLRKPRLMGEEEFRHAPHVVGIEDDHIRGTPGQLVYVRGLDAPPGASFAVLRPIGRYYEITSKENQPPQVYRQPLDDRDDRPSQLWYHGPEEFTLRGDVHFIGYEMLQFATVQVTHAGDPASTLVVSADYELRPGDYIAPLDDKPFDFEFVPHGPRQPPAPTQVIAFTDALNAVGRLQVVAISRGARDGIDNGQVLSIFHPGSTVTDRTDYPDFSVKAFLHHDESKVKLPEEYVGHVMIFRTFDVVSYGLVMDGIRPVHLGDHLYEPEHR